MKTRKIIVTILLALVAIMVLQLQVNATDFDFSTYDYALTETGIVAKNDLTGEETIIAIIKGEYTGTIEKIGGENTIKISNFNADGLKFSSEQYALYIEGVNVTALDHGDYDITGNGLLKYFNRGQWLYSSGQPYGEVIIDYYDPSSFDINLPNRIFYVGTYIKEMKTVGDEHYKYINMDNCANVDWDKVIEYFTYEIDSLSYNCSVSVIPSKVFKELEKHQRTTFSVDGDNGKSYRIDGSDIINSEVDFTIGYEKSYEPKWDMVDINLDDVVYINFAHSGPVPGPIVVDFPDETFTAGDTLKCYYYNETTKLYEPVEDATAIYDNQLQLNIDHCSKFVVSKTELPAELVSENNDENNGGVADEKWCVETEVDSLVWTEEDINSVLAAIEETRNNTTQKQLYVNVPSGSKVPAKIFEASNGIKITIISEDGIWAYFSGESYKEIDYVAGGTISNKPIEGMVNVGEDTIVYLSLKHEGQLPSSCVISYFKGLTEIGQGIGGDDTFVDTKLYYFNREVQKYELCGSGYMSLPYDIYVFEIDHCSSYVMAEKSLPDEFVIASKTEDKEENKVDNKEENKTENKEKNKETEKVPVKEEKEDSDKDTTKVEGSIPYTGGMTVIMLSMVVIATVGAIAYIKNRELKGI